MLISSTVWETLNWIIVAIVIASRWFKTNSVQISSLKVRVTKLPALKTELQAQCRVSLIRLIRLPTSSSGSLVGLSVAFRGCMGSGSDFSLSCQKPGSLWGGTFPGLLICPVLSLSCWCSCQWEVARPQHNWIILNSRPEHAQSSVLWQDQSKMVCLCLSVHWQGLVGPHTCRKDTLFFLSLLQEFDFVKKIIF